MILTLTTEADRPADVTRREAPDRLNRVEFSPGRMENVNTSPGSGSTLLKAPVRRNKKETKDHTSWYKCFNDLIGCGRHQVVVTGNCHIRRGSINCTDGQRGGQTDSVRRDNKWLTLRLKETNFQ